MSNDRIASTWDQIKKKLNAHWGKLSVEDLCLQHARSELSSGTRPADSAVATPAQGRLALARSGS